MNECQMSYTIRISTMLKLVKGFESIKVNNLIKTAISAVVGILVFYTAPINYNDIITFKETLETEGDNIFRKM